jgi:hypothetical protein
VVQEDIEKVIVHPARSETAKPFARAEVIATGKGLLSGAVLVVAGARNGPQWMVGEPLPFRLVLTLCPMQRGR